MSLEAKEFIARTTIFLKCATNNEFEQICDDVSGRFKNSRSLCRENGVFVYPGRLEELFADEKWDLEKNVRWRVNHALQDFNKSLNAAEKLPATLGDDFVDALSREPQCTALAAIRKINNTYFDKKIWKDTEVWSGVRDLAVSVEVHGKEWIGGRRPAPAPSIPRVPAIRAISGNVNSAFFIFPPRILKFYQVLYVMATAYISLHISTRNPQQIILDALLVGG